MEPDQLPVRIGTPQELSERLTFEYARGARHGTPLTLLVLHFFLWNQRSDRARDRLEQHVTEHFLACMRVSDGLFDFGMRGCYVAVLPHTSPAEAALPCARLEQRSNLRPAAETGPVKIDVFPVDLGVPDAVSLLDRLEAFFRCQALLPPGAGRPPPPPARVPLRGLGDLQRALFVELNFAGREGSHLSVLSLFAAEPGEAPPGLLARHATSLAPGSIRTSDAVFSVGPNHVALVMPRTESGSAAAVGARITAALEQAYPDAPYGRLAQTALEFDRVHRDVPAILQALRRTSSVAEPAAEPGADA
jgi:hypothetical protein